MYLECVGEIIALVADSLHGSVRASEYTAALITTQLHFKHTIHALNNVY